MPTDIEHVTSCLKHISFLTILGQIKKILNALIILIPLFVAIIWRWRVRKVQDRKNEIADN